MNNQPQIVHQIPTLTSKQTKFWQFKNSAEEENTAELRIDGNIVDDSDVWIYEWFGEPAAAPNAFREELVQYVGKNINVWIDSYGGSVFAATGIYNALMNHKQTGVTVNTIGDGKIMSAAATIFMAGDKRKMSPGCLFMMHNPLTGAYGYASDLRKAADVLDVVKECVITAYQVSTGLDAEKISAMMEDETYMSAKSAVKNGFATEVLYEQIDVNDVQNSVINFNFNRHAVQNAAEDSMKKFFAFARSRNSNRQLTSTIIAAPTENPKNKEAKTMDIKQLQAEYPDLYKEIFNAGVTAERTRMKAIDEVQMAGFEEIINKARYETGASAEQVALQIVNAQKQLGNQYLNNRQEDVTASNLAKVPSTPAPEAKELEEKEVQAAAQKIADYINEGR